MELGAVLQETFVLLLAEWTVEKALLFLEGITATHVIVKRESNSQVYYYLFSQFDVEENLRITPSKLKIADALELHEYTATEAFDASNESEQLPSRAIVLDKDIVIGFVDESKRQIQVTVPEFASTKRSVPQTAGRSPIFESSEEFEVNESASFPMLEDIAGSDSPRSYIPKSPVLNVGRETIRKDGVFEKAIESSTVTTKPKRSPNRGKKPQAPAPPPFEAYPLLTMPETGLIGTPFDIYVGFREDLDSQLTEVMQISVANPKPGEECLILLVADGLDLDRIQDQIPLRVNASTHFTGVLKEQVSSASVKALFVYQGQLIGSARREIRAISQVTSPAAPEVPPRLNPCRSSIPTGDACVDITVSITHLQDNILQWHIMAPTFPDVANEVFQKPLSGSTEFAGKLMNDLRPPFNAGPDARNIVETVGQAITDCMPSKFFETLRDVQLAVKRTPTLLLLTNEVQVPWELAFIEKPLSPDAPPFLAAQTHMGRWLEDINVMLPPATSLEVNRITAVASLYGLESRLPELKEALAEQEDLFTNWKAVKLEATKPEMDALVSGTITPGHLVHFSVHGFSDPEANNEALLLADRIKYPASALTGAYSCGQTPRFGFTFLNACQVATPGKTLGQAGGFPGILVRHGVLGFIAPLWEVDDVVARDLALNFYKRTLGDKETIGEVLHSQRSAYDNGNTTPMAYIYYGHPALRLKYAGK